MHSCIEALKKYELSDLYVTDYHNFSVWVMDSALKDDDTVTVFLSNYKRGQLPDKLFFLNLSIHSIQMKWTPWLANPRSTEF